MMMVEIALHTILAAMIGGIWLSVMVVAPAAEIVLIINPKDST